MPYYVNWLDNYASITSAFILTRMKGLNQGGKQKRDFNRALQERNVTEKNFIKQWNFWSEFRKMSTSTAVLSKTLSVRNFFFSKRGTFLHDEVIDVNSRDNIGMQLVMNATVPYLYRS